jgi:hypothetical protein
MHDAAPERGKEKEVFLFTIEANRCIDGIGHLEGVLNAVGVWTAGRN